MRRQLGVGGALLALTVSQTHAQCAVDVQPMRFGVLPDLSRRNANAEGGVVVHCDSPRGVRIAVGYGEHTLMPPQRRLAGAADAMSYQIYSDAARTRVWGDGQGVAPDVAAVSGTLVPMYGRIPQGQRPTPGTYTDIIEITVSW